MQSPNPYDPDVQLENACVLLFNHSFFVAAAGMFAHLLSRQPTNSSAWYAVSRSVAAISKERNDSELLIISIVCLRRALVEDPNNKFAAELHGRLMEIPDFIALERANLPPFDGSPFAISSVLGFSPKSVVEAFQALQEWELRAKLVMWLGNQPIPDVVPLLIAAVDDRHRDVSMAAIKRLAYWPDSEGVRQCLERLVNDGKARELQPYPSIALVRIQRDWAADLQAKLRNS